MRGLRQPMQSLGPRPLVEWGNLPHHDALSANHAVHSGVVRRPGAVVGGVLVSPGTAVATSRLNSRTYPRHVRYSRYSLLQPAARGFVHRAVRLGTPSPEFRRTGTRFAASAGGRRNASRAAGRCAPLARSRRARRQGLRLPHGKACALSCLPQAGAPVPSFFFLKLHALHDHWQENHHRV